MVKTTIQISNETLERLRALKRFERESYEEIINVIVDEYEDERLTVEEIEGIKEALENVKQGKTISFEDVLKKAGIGAEECTP